VYFSDGTQLTSADVEATFTRMFALPDSVQTDFTTCIKGAQAILDGTADTLEGIVVKDDFNFDIVLEEPFAGFLSVLATPTCCIFSKKNLEEAGDDFGMDPAQTIGSNAYMVTEWIPNSSLTLVRNPYYWGEPGSAEEVQYTVYPEAASMDMAFQSGELDILDCDFLDSALVSSTYETMYADQMMQVNRLGVYYFFMNEDIEPMNDLKVRQAIQMAVNRQSILDSIYGGKGVVVDGIFPAGAIGFTEDNQGWLTYDPEGAKALLAEAGYADGFDLELCADSSSGANRLNILQIIQQNLQDVGINANIVSYDESSFLAKRKSGEMSTFTSPWTLDYNDPSNVIDTFFGSESATKGRSLNYKDTDIMARVSAATSITDEDERMAEYAALEKKIVQEDAAFLPLFCLQHQFVLSDSIESFEPHWAGYSDFNVNGVKMK
jgi:peptide/nickel transport system substrate-binding protein